MTILEWVRMLAAAALIGSGLFALFVTTTGIFRFKYVLNRIHVASKCDTLGILLTVSGMIVLRGFDATSLKMMLLVVFLWIANPVSSHLIAYLEVATNPDIEKECEVVRNDNN